MYRDGKVSLSPSVSVSEYVRMGVSFTAIRVRLSGECRRSVGEGGIVLTSDPVSTRNRMCCAISNVKEATLRRAGDTCRR